jgi:hypothetical protein
MARRMMVAWMLMSGPLLGMQIVQASAEDFVIPPGFEEAYKQANADCHDKSLPPQQVIDACNLAIKIATMDSEIRATNSRNRADAALNRLLLESLSK